MKTRELWKNIFLAATMLVGCFWLSIPAQLSTNAPIIVQPGAPGEPTRILPPSTRPVLPPTSRKDVEFMQGMIHHHVQAVEMVALMDERTTNKELRLLGARISHTQADEMRFMELWLRARGEPTSMGHKMPATDHTMHGHDAQPMLMPGMLTADQMKALENSKGKDFDRLFLTGMIQHHSGALTMVRELADTAGAAQDADLFNFITDVDSGQSAEIRIMQEMLDKAR